MPDKELRTTPRKEIVLPPELIREIAEIYQAMQDDYEKIAGQIPLTCQDCSDNCCDSYFQHHTYSEWAYLWEGLRQLDDATLQRFKEKAKEYVSYQLKARQLIRQALGADVLGSYPDLTAFEAFENKLEADLSNLQQVLEQARKVEDKIEWSDVPNLAGILGTPETYLWPVLPSQSSEFQFPEISPKAKSYINSQLGYQPEEDTGFATVPPQEPVADLNFGSLL